MHCRLYLNGVAIGGEIAIPNQVLRGLTEYHATVVVHERDAEPLMGIARLVRDPDLEPPDPDVGSER